MRIPTVKSLHPLWDEHDEFADPRNERALDRRPPDAVDHRASTPSPQAITKGDADTILPLVLAGGDHRAVRAAHDPAPDGRSWIGAAP